MKFIVRAQLLKTLAQSLRDKGFDVADTSALTDGNDTTDDEINRPFLAENRIVISKDGDFYDSFSAEKESYKCSILKRETLKTRNSSITLTVKS